MTPSSLHNGNLWTAKTASLYWNFPIRKMFFTQLHRQATSKQLHLNISHLKSFLKKCDSQEVSQIFGLLISLQITLAYPFYMHSLQRYFMHNKYLHCCGVINYLFKRKWKTSRAKATSVYATFLHGELYIPTEIHTTRPWRYKTKCLRYFWTLIIVHRMVVYNDSDDMWALCRFTTLAGRQDCLINSLPMLTPMKTSKFYIVDPLGGGGGGGGGGIDQLPMDSSHKWKVMRESYC